MEFVFYGDALALDFVNTEVMVRGIRRDLLAKPQDFVRWMQKAKQYHAEVNSAAVVDEEFLQHAKRLRMVLRRLFTAVSAQQTPDGEDIAVLNSWLRQGHYVLETREGGTFAAEYRAESAETPLLTLALAAFRLLTQGDLSRIHQCKNERCILMFYDQSKNGARRWCNWSCLNRARSIENYRKAKGENE